MTAARGLSLRWQTPEGAQLASEVFRRLRLGRPLDNLKLVEHENRIDLRGLHAPDTKREHLAPFRGWSLQRLTGQLTFRNVYLEDLDLSGSRLNDFLFFDSRVSNCRFDAAQCESWKLWGTDVTRSTFVGADLRRAVLGPWYEGRGNRFSFVDFSKADMRNLISPAAVYTDCNFSNARLERIEFQSSSFIRCRFAGEIRKVIFYDHGFKTGKPDPNPMEDVDFSNAKFRWVEFRRLNLDRVRLPEDANHLIVKHYRCVLTKALEAIAGNENLDRRVIRAILQNRLKWIGPNQKIGVFSRYDFRESGGEECEDLAVDLLRRAERDCAGERIN